MTHSEIVAYLDAKATEAGAASFWHGKQAQANINYNAPFPQAHLFLMPSQLANGKATTDITMGFYGLDKHENGGPDSSGIQDEMDRLTQRFYALLAEEVNPELVGGKMSRTPAFRVGGIVGTGFVCSFSLATLPLC